MGKERKMEKLILLPESERLYIRVVTLAEWENQFKKKKKKTKKGANNILKFGVDVLTFGRILKSKYFINN